MTTTSPQRTSTPAQRWWARGAVLLALAAVLVLVVTEGVAAIVLPLLVLATLAVAVGGVWLALARRGAVRWLGVALAVVTPLVPLLLAARFDLLSGLLAAAVLGVAALLCARQALRPDTPAEPMPERTTAAPQRPVILMNPRSGDGKVERFGLVTLARERGAEVILIEPGPDGAEIDVAALAQDAVTRGADLLGVAGGDGTQALVAGVAAEHGLPFLVVSAGTRNHFALDLGLDRDDPRRCLDALTDGVELSIDLGRINGRPFVNNASFGAYAEVVRHPGYREDKWGTTLKVLPELLAGAEDIGVTAAFGDVVLPDPDAVLVSNNPYGTGDVAGMGRRLRLDAGVLGVIALEVTSAREAASLLRGRSSPGVTTSTVDRVVVTATSGRVAVGIDGESVELPTPVVCSIDRGALRVRVPRQRPGVVAPTPPLDWRRVRDLALGRS